MLSIGVIGPAGVDYYLGTVASGVDDYYLHAEPGTWYGTGAAALGLAGVVVDDDLHAVLDGVAPHGTGALGRATKVAAFDCTFSAPKSVSVLAELGDPDTRAAVLEAHRAAVAATVGLLEAEVVRGRRGHGGGVQVPTVGLVAAGFDHRSSRAGDPQLHTHLLVANRAQGIDGAWGALYGRRRFAWAKTAGIAYQAFLRAELTSALGVSWGPVVNGTAEVTGISEGLRELFSTRRAQITAHLAGEGRDGARAAQVATLATRPAKPEPIHPDMQRAHWQKQAAELGVTAASIAAVLGPQREPIAVDLGALAQELTGAGGLTARRSTFDARHLYQAVAAGHRDGLQPARLTELIGSLQRHRGARGRRHRPRRPRLDDRRAGRHRNPTTPGRGTRTERRYRCLPGAARRGGLGPASPRPRTSRHGPAAMPIRARRRSRCRPTGHRKNLSPRRRRGHLGRRGNPGHRRPMT
jgi:conjugative relaxase-like TrwC/TraI family protein